MESNSSLSEEAPPPSGITSDGEEDKAKKKKTKSQKGKMKSSKEKDQSENEENSGSDLDTKKKKTKKKRREEIDEITEKKMNKKKNKSKIKKIEEEENEDSDDSLKKNKKNKQKNKKKQKEEEEDEDDDSDKKKEKGKKSASIKKKKISKKEEEDSNEESEKSEKSEKSETDKKKKKTESKSKQKSNKGKNHEIDESTEKHKSKKKMHKKKKDNEEEEEKEDSEESTKKGKTKEKQSLSKAKKTKGEDEDEKEESDESSEEKDKVTLKKSISKKRKKANEIEKENEDSENKGKNKSKNKKTSSKNKKKTSEEEEESDDAMKKEETHKNSDEEEDSSEEKERRKKTKSKRKKNEDKKEDEEEKSLSKSKSKKLDKSKKIAKSKEKISEEEEEIESDEKTKKSKESKKKNSGKDKSKKNNKDEDEEESEKTENEEEQQKEKQKYKMEKDGKKSKNAKKLENEKEEENDEGETENNAKNKKKGKDKTKEDEEGESENESEEKEDKKSKKLKKIADKEKVESKDKESKKTEQNNEDKEKDQNDSEKEQEKNTSKSETKDEGKNKCISSDNKEDEQVIDTGDKNENEIKHHEDESNFKTINPDENNQSNAEDSQSKDEKGKIKIEKKEIKDNIEDKIAEKGENESNAKDKTSDCNIENENEEEEDSKIKEKSKKKENKMKDEGKNKEEKSKGKFKKEKVKDNSLEENEEREENSDKEKIKGKKDKESKMADNKKKKGKEKPKDKNEIDGSEKEQNSDEEEENEGKNKKNKGKNSKMEKAHKKDKNKKTKIEKNDSLEEEENESSEEKDENEEDIEDMSKKKKYSKDKYKEKDGKSTKDKSKKISKKSSQTVDKKGKKLKQKDIEELGSSEEEEEIEKKGKNKKGKTTIKNKRGQISDEEEESDIKNKKNKGKIGKKNKNDEDSEEEGSEKRGKNKIGKNNDKTENSEEEDKSQKKGKEKKEKTNKKIKDDEDSDEDEEEIKKNKKKKGKNLDSDENSDEMKNEKSDKEKKKNNKNNKKDNNKNKKGKNNQKEDNEDDEELTKNKKNEKKNAPKNKMDKASKNKKNTSSSTEKEEEEEEEEEEKFISDKKKINDKKEDNKDKKESSSDSSDDDDEDEKKEKNKKKEEKPQNKIKPKPQKQIPKPKVIQKPKSDYITNIHIIKPNIKSKNENGLFLKDNIDTSKKMETDEFILYAEQNITNEIDILEENKKKLRKSEKFFNDIGYVLTDKSCERMAMLIHYILNGIPVLLEGPTGTSKTRTTLIACEYITKILNKSDDDDSLLRFNLSAETKIDDLLVKFTGDNNSASGLKVEEGQFFKAYTKGHKILLDEINLAPREVLECIQQALDSKVLSVECSGKILKPYKMHPNFGIIATQNPNKGAFANKRQELGVGFLSRFQKINFPNFTKEELIDIAKGLAKQNDYAGDENILIDIVSFHMDWQEETNLVDDVQCFTIREIEGIIRAIAQKKNIYDTIMTVYGARYQKKMKEQLKNKLKNYKTLQKLQPSSLALPDNFPHCFSNNNLCETVSSVLFSLSNQRHAIIVGEDESGITQVARWCAQCYNRMTNDDKDKDNNLNENDKNCFCLCTKNLQCSDLIGQTKPCPKNEKGESNEILKFIPGFLVDAIEQGKTVVLDCINEANATVGERLNGLLDKKNNASEEFFDLPENTERLKIPIHKNFRMICTCNINNIKDMSPAFVNRFDVIVLENQLENLTDNQIKNFITNIYVSFDRIPQKKKKANLVEEQNLAGIQFDDDEEEGEYKDNNEEDAEISENKEEIIKKEKEFAEKEKELISKICSKIKFLPETKVEDKNGTGYSHLRTITSLSRLCYGIKKLRNILQQTKYEEAKITDDDIINTVFDMLFKDDTEKIQISENIKSVFLKELIEENKKKMESKDKDKYEKYFFENSESLKKFVLIVYISSLINLYLCVVSPPGSGKTTAARAIAEIRAKIFNQLIPFYIHTHHSSTKPNDFYGTTTISESEVIFKEGSLTSAIKEGSVYIADEFNISSELNMKSVTPVLEQTFNQDLIIPGIEGYTSIDPNFFFIICQNDVGTFGRNELPDKIKTKLRKIKYPEQSKEEIESICSSLNNSLYSEGQKNRLDDIEARYCGDFMIKVNHDGLTSQSWSLRDISKIFARMKNQKTFPENFKEIGTAVNLLFYALSSTQKDQIDEDNLDKILLALQEIFKERVNYEDLKEMFKSTPILFNEKDPKSQKRSYYIQKHKSLIFLDKVDEGSKINEEENKKKSKKLEQFSKLPNLLDCLFKMKLSNYDEPLLLSGLTCYKTFAAKIILNNADIVSLNQESTIPQLLGASFFYPPIEDKKFCMRLIYEILEIPNIEIELNKVDNWKENKEEVKKLIEEKMPDNDSSFYIALTNLKNKLFAEEKVNEKSLINMEIEFKPGLILSAILNKKSLILKDMPQVKTIVLERFNELFSGKHNLTLVEDIPGTLTTKENKELRNFNENFRVIATCKPGDELKLSEALLSRFTVIACEPYSEKEEKVVLESSVVQDKDIDEIKNRAPELNLTERLNCLRISKYLDNYNKDDHENNLRIALYVLQKGITEQRENQTDAIKEKFKVNIPDYEIGKCPFEDPEISQNKGNQYLQSTIYKLKMLSFQKEISLYDKKIFFTKKFSEICDIILFGLSLRMPIILEGETGQGKQTAIHYMATRLGLDIINIVISKSTKVDDLLMKIIIEKSETGEILVKNQETELYNAIKCTDEYPKKLILFQGINNASPAVLDVLNSIFTPNARILLSNGSILKKGNMNIIGIFNKGRDNISKDKIPAGILSNCIYHIVDNPSSDDILNIIVNLFIKIDFGKEENIKYTKNYLIEKHTKESEIESIISDKQKFETEFLEAKKYEADDFAKKFVEAKLFSMDASNEAPFTLNDIKKYIDFRESVPQINHLLIQLFIFVYHFSQEDYINKITEKLGLLKNIEFLPIIDYDEDKEYLVIKLEKEAKESIRVKVKNPKRIKPPKCKKLFDTLTKSQKHCFIFLICCIISKKTPIIQGPTASGKSYLISVLAVLLGQDLDTNLYQMNSNTGMSILTGQEIIKGNFDDDEKRKICEAYENIKDLINYNKAFNDMKLKHYKKIISKIDKKLKEQGLDEETMSKLKSARRTIFIIISPPSRFTHIDSKFIDSIIKGDGQWVILDGIEMAPSQIPEKITPLCGENPELSIYESGKGIYITSKNIKEQFQLFIIYNPFNKGSKILDPVLFNKCVSFSLPPIDNSQLDSATTIYNSLKLSKKCDKNAWNRISSKLAACHIFSAKMSENHLEQMAGGIKITPRNLVFLTTDQNKSTSDFADKDETVNWIKSVLTFYYFNSFIDLPSDKTKDNRDTYTKENFMNGVYKEFQKKQNLIITAKDISEEEMFPEIVNALKQVQIDSQNSTSQYNFNFGSFVTQCLSVPIEKSNLEYIKNQIEDTLNLLNYSNLSNESLFSFYQIKIIHRFYGELLDKIDSVKVENKGQKLNSDELLRISSLKPILLKLRLLEGLVNKGKSNFGYNMNNVLHIPDINELIYKLNSLLLNKSKNTLKSFILFLIENHHFLKVLETIFPFNKFNELYKDKDFEVVFYYIKMMIEFYKNKTNFVFIFDNEELSFIFEEKQYDRLLPILKLNEQKTVYLSIGTSLQYYKKDKKDASNVNLISTNNDVNKEKTIHFIKFFTEYPGRFDSENLKNLLGSFNKDNYDLVSEKKFLSSKFFLSNNSIIPKMWTFLFSFDENSEVLKYIIDNFLPFEREIFFIIKNNFYDTLNEKYQIQTLLDFTEKLNFFYSEESFLWRNLIGKKLEKTTDEAYRGYENAIEKELLNLENLKEFSWPDDKFISYQEILIAQKDEIKEKLQKGKIDAQLKEEQKKLRKMKDDLKNLGLKGGLEVFKSDLIEKINNLLNENLDNIIKKSPIIQQEINDLKAISKEKSISLSGNDLGWGKPLLKTKLGEDSPTIKLYKNMLFYATCNELEQKILHAKDNKERIRYGTQIEKLGLKALLKYINSLGDEALGTENRKTIKSMFRVELMLRLWNDSIDQVAIKNFIMDLNEKISRNIISEEEYGFTYQIANDYSLNTKIIQPKFEPKDIIYLFFKYNENNEYSAGPIFDNIEIPRVNMNNLFKEALYNSNNLNNMCDISVICAQILYKEFMKKYQIELENDFNKLLIYFQDENKNMKQSAEKKELQAIINGMKLAKYIQTIIESTTNTTDNAISFEDIRIFDKKDEKRIEIESLLNKKINPSFKYFIIKNIQLIKELINSKLKSEDISELFKPNVNYIPFWVFLIRNMSSINCVNYESNDNPFSNEITIDVRQKIQGLIVEKKENEIDDSWLNLVLRDIPSEILNPNVRLFYYYFNYLFDKLNADGKLKEKIEKILKEKYLELLKMSFEGNLNEILNGDITNDSLEDILQLINSPKEFIKKNIIKEYSDKTKNILVNNKYSSLEKNLEDLIKVIPEKMEEIENNVNQIEDIYKTKEIEDEIKKKKKIINDEIKKYNKILDDLKKSKGVIDTKNIENLEKVANKIDNYRDLISNNSNEDTIIIHKILIKNERNLIISFDNTPLNIQNINELYFNIDEINEEFKNKFKIIPIQEEPKHKNAKNNKKPNEAKNKNIEFKDLNAEIKIEDYIFFEKASKLEKNKIKIDLSEEEQNDTIKNNYLDKNMTFNKVTFRGKTYSELSQYIEKLKNNLINIQDILIKLSNGEFENLDIENIKNKYNISEDNFKKFFDISNNKNQDEIDNFKAINKIKKEFESSLLSIDKDFIILSKDFEQSIGDMKNNLSEKLEKIYITNFNLPSLPGEKPHYVDYDNLDSDSPLLSMPTISKKDGILKCNYNKISFQKGPFCPEFYSKPIKLNIMSLVDEEIKAEIEEYPEENDSENDKESCENESDNENNQKKEKKGNDNIEKKDKNTIKENDLNIDEKNKINNNHDEENKNKDEQGEKNSDGDISENDEKKIYIVNEENNNDTEQKDNNIEQDRENENNKLINEEKKISILDRKDTDSMKYMKVKEYILPKESIQIEIYIPNCVKKGKKEYQRIRRLLKLTAGNTTFNLEVEITILTIPIELLLSCENYKLEYFNDYYYLKENQIFSEEQIKFCIQNYLEGENILVKTRIDSLDGNTSKEPIIELKDNYIILNIPKLSNSEVKRLNCRIEFYISPSYKIPIRIDSVIIPMDYSFKVYDFSKKCFVSNNMEILLPTTYSEDNFIKYLPDNLLEINLQFLINTPYRNKKLASKIAINFERNERNVYPEFQEKEIIIEKEKYEFGFKLTINCANLIGYNIVEFICVIAGLEKKITISKKNFYSSLNYIDLKELDLFKFYYNSDMNSYKIEKILNNNDIKKDGIYICHLGQWNFKTVKYTKIPDNYNKNKFFYKLAPVPENNIIYSISNDGKIMKDEKNTFENYSERGGILWLSKSYYYPLFGICENQWYPLIGEYEDEKLLFDIPDEKSLKNIYDSFRQLRERYYDFNYYKYCFDYEPCRKAFYNYLSYHFPETHEKYLKKNYYYYYYDDYRKELNNISNNINENRVLNILKRFENLKKDKEKQNIFGFSYFAYLIFDKPKETLDSINKYFPNEIKEKIIDETNFVLNFTGNRNADWNSFNNNKLKLIKKLYNIFLQKLNEIKNNHNQINLSVIDQKLITDKIKELQMQYYSYKPINTKEKTDSIGKLYQDIQAIAQEILIEEEKRKKEMLNMTNDQKINISIIADKFLLIDNERKSVDKNTNQIKSISTSELNNPLNSIDLIEIDEIIQPDNYSINTLMQFFGSCILKTQILPAFIRYAYKIDDKKQQIKATQILSDLFNLYKSINNYNLSLISPRTEEYKKSFEIMFSKLKNSGVNFKNDPELKKLSVNNDDTIEDFIILPEKDNFNIRPNAFERDENDESYTNNISTSASNKQNKIIFKKTGIKTIQESQIMNLEYENLIKRKKIEKIKDTIKKNEELDKNHKKSTTQNNNPQPVIQANKELQRVYSLLEQRMQEDNKSSTNNFNFQQKDKDKPKNRTGLVKKKADNKKVKITGKNFEGQNFDVEKETNRVIDKIKSFDRTKLKLDEVSEREGKLDKLYESEKLKEYLNAKVQISEDSSINKLMESSEFLSSSLFSAISQLNLKDEIPFKSLEVNILLDCARTIGDTEKFFVMLQVCALTTVFHSLEIPYLISVVGDSGFKVVLKELDEEHSIENLQKALDCIFIKRCNTNIASCIKTATDKFKSIKGDDAHRVFYMFTNGLDEEFNLTEQWKDRIFSNPNHSFAFIFSKPKTIKKNASDFLTNYWNKFSKFCKDNYLPVEMIEMSKEKFYKINNNMAEINEENISNYIKSITTILRRYKERDNMDKTEKSLFEIEKLDNIPSGNNLINLGKIISDDTFREMKDEPYIKKVQLPHQHEAAPKINKKEFNEISKNIGSILKIKNKIEDDVKAEIRNFMKLFKIRKEKINLSLLELIFKPNLATQTILTDVGTHIDVNELIKYFLNPTPNPRIYREIGDGFIKNYGVTVIIDSSISCFGTLSNQHTWITIQMLLSAIGAVDLPCFDLIISGNPNPYIVCSEKNTLDALSEKSQIWPIVFDLLNKNIKNTDLASAIKAAYNLHNSRKSEHPDFLFVVTDGLFSSSEIPRIIKNVNFCMMKGLNVFGIGVGISPNGIEKLFPSIIYSLNPDKLIQGIASCFSGSSLSNANMSMKSFELKFLYDDTNIIDSQKNPKYKELKNELMNIPVELSGYDYYLTEIPPDAKEEELTGDGKFSVHHYGMYEQNFFLGQKLLIVMPYSYGMNEGEDSRLSYEYILKSPDGSECIQSSIDFTGIKAEVVINYKDAIDRLTRQGSKKNCCDYYACIIMSGEPYPELPNPNDDPYLFGQFIKVIEQFWKNGGGLGLFADNAPFNYQINVIIEKLFPNCNFRVAGNHPGQKTIYADESGQLSEKATFNKKIQMMDNFARNIISHSLYSIYEGKTISYFVEKPNDDDLLYYGKNEELTMITDPKLLEPFIPFSKDSDGGFNSVFYCSNDDKGDIVVDCSYTKFFLEMGTQGTPRYIQNIVSWLGAPEKHQRKDNCKDGTEYRPKSIDLQINWNDRWTGFKKRPVNMALPENMKTLFAVDCSGSVYGSIKETYFSKLKELRTKYYKSSRGDKFYIWGSDYKYRNESEMERFLSGEYTGGGTSSYLIAEIGRETKNEKFEHLVIVTDGGVGSGDIDKSDKSVKIYGLQYSYVSTYIIGSGGNESVGCPYSRGCPGVTYLIDRYGNERKQASLSREDQQALNEINSISSWSTFKSKYPNLFNAIRARCLGKEADSDLMSKLNNLKSRIYDAGSEQNDFNNKFNELYRMASGQIRNVNNASVAA